jgi:acetyl esterase
MTDGRYSRAGLRPEVEMVLAAVRAGKADAPQPTPIDQLREMTLAGAAFMNIGAPEIALERTITIDTGEAQVRALVWAPVAEPRGLPLVLHLHGGGFVWMLPESFAKPWKEVAIAANVIVVSLDYRLAPEHPYPAPLDDCVGAFRWLRTHAEEIGGDRGRIAVVGESAGGGLAASTTLRLIAEGDEPPAAVAVASAWLDLRNSSPSFAALGPDDALIDSVTMDHWRRSYAPREEQWLDPLVSPVLADVSSMPPACVVAAGIDPLYDDGMTFAANLRAAGRSVELHEYAGMPHIFWCFPPLFALNDVTARIAAFLQRQLRG